jgi:hypothetical protein
MFMRYVGGGIGHRQHMSTLGGNAMDAMEAGLNIVDELLGPPTEDGPPETEVPEVLDDSSGDEERPHGEDVQVDGDEDWFSNAEDPDVIKDD